MGKTGLHGYGYGCGHKYGYGYGSMGGSWVMDGMNIWARMTEHDL